MRKKILIIITGSIAAYKALYLIRKLKEKDFFINVIMTNSAKKFITPLSVSSLSEKRVYEAEDPNDVLHAGRSHNDKKFSLWFRKNIGEDVSIKISSRLRSRETDSGYEWVSDLKSFNQLQFWINIEWDLVYDQY